MKRENVSPILPNSLIAIHAIIDFLSELQIRKHHSASIKQQEMQFNDFLLSDLLWSKASYVRLSPKISQLHYLSSNPPISTLLEIFRIAKLDDLPCEIWLSEEHLMRCVNTRPLHSVNYLNSKSINLWESVKKNVSEGNFATHTTFGEGYDIFRALIEARSEICHQLFLDTKEDDALLLQQVSDFRPISFALVSQAEKICEILRRVEDSYLDAVIQGRVLWHTNIMKWEKQVEYLMGLIKAKYEKHGDFWLNLSVDSPGHNEGNGYELVESLLALNKRGDISLTKLRENPLYVIEFRIHVPQPKTVIEIENDGGSWRKDRELENGRPVSPDLLLSIHLIVHFLDRIEDKMHEPYLPIFDERTKAEIELEELRKNILDDLLWESISYGFGTVKVAGGREVDQLLMSQLITMFIGEEQFKDLEIHIHLSDEETHAYAQTSIPSDLTNEPVGSGIMTERQLWKAVTNGQRITLGLGEPNVYRFVDMLLMARYESIRHSEHDLEFDEQAEQRRKNFRPISIDFLSEPAKLREFLTRKIKRYLHDFTEDKIDWNVNQPKWERQTAYFIPILKKLDDLHGAFWISTDDLQASHGWKPESGYKLLETLLAINILGHFTTFAVRRRGTGVEFKMLLKTVEELSETTTKQVTPIASVVSDQSTEKVPMPSKTERQETDIPHGKCIELDGFISLSDQENKMGLYIKSQAGWTFYQQPPQMIRIIRHFYDIRTAPQNSLMVKQLAEKFTKTGAASSPISRNLSSLKDFCQQHGCKEILMTTSDGKWTLNSKLDCCKATQVR